MHQASETPLTVYNYPITMRLFYALFTIVFSIAGPALMLFALYDPFFVPSETAPFVALLEHLKTVFSRNIGLFFISLGQLCVAWLIPVMVPTIIVQEKGIKVTNFFGLIASDWLPWQSIQAIRGRPYGNSWSLSIHGLDFRYRILGLTTMVFEPVVMISKQLENHRQLLQTIKKHRPDLLADPQLH